MPAPESRPRVGHAIFLVLALVLATARPAAGAGASAPSAAPRADVSYELEYTGATHLAFELAGSGIFTASVLVLAGPAALRCSWCSASRFDEGARDAFRAGHPRTAAALSHVFSYTSAPALALAAVVAPAFMRGRSDHAAQNFVILLDSVLLTYGVTHGTKRAFSRARPAVRHGVVHKTEYADFSAQWNESFFSGDTSLAFALGSSAATLSFLRGYPSAPWVVFAGSILGVSTACLRMAADMHWATDVLAGAAVGTAIGFGVPYFLHPRVGSSPGAFTLVPVVGRGELGVLAGASF